MSERQDGIGLETSEIQTAQQIICEMNISKLCKV